jgi:hypothetical protein
VAWLFATVCLCIWWTWLRILSDPGSCHPLVFCSTRAWCSGGTKAAVDWPLKSSGNYNP